MKLPIVGALALPPAAAAIAVGAVGLGALAYRWWGPMRLVLTRDYWLSDRVLGTLTIDGQPFGYTVEDTDRDLDSDMRVSDIIARTIATKTAIARGIYALDIHDSPSQGREVLHLVDVPGNRWILIHSGNDPSASSGCILVGLHRDLAKGTISDSRAAVSWLETNKSGPMAALRAGRRVTIEVRGERPGGYV